MWVGWRQRARWIYAAKKFSLCSSVPICFSQNKQINRDPEIVPLENNQKKKNGEKFARNLHFHLSFTIISNFVTDLDRTQFKIAEQKKNIKHKINTQQTKTNTEQSTSIEL